MVLQAPLLQGINQRLAGAGVPEVDSADLDGACAGEHELNHIFGGADTADADYRDLDRLCRLPYHTQRDWPDGRARESGGDVRDSRLARFGVDCHRDEGVDKRDSVRARVLGSTRYIGDAGYIGRELDDQR